MRHGARAPRRPRNHIPQSAGQGIFGDTGSKLCGKPRSRGKAREARILEHRTELQMSSVKSRRVSSPLRSGRSLSTVVGLGSRGWARAQRKS